MPREPKKKQEVDVSKFQPLIDEALNAFGADFRYAVEMSRAAVTIERKRKIWKPRSEKFRVEE